MQIDLGEDKTIGDVDVYGNLETQQTPFSCMIAMLGSADYHAAVDEEELVTQRQSGAPVGLQLWTLNGRHQIRTPESSSA